MHASAMNSGSCTSAGQRAIGQCSRRDAALNAIPLPAMNNKPAASNQRSGTWRSVSVIPSASHHSAPQTNSNGDNCDSSLRIVAAARCNCSAENSAAAAIISIPSPLLLITGSVPLSPCRDSAMKASAAATCSSNPNRRASRRCWRIPAQSTAAPSTAHAALVQRASSASGIASVPKISASAKKLSTSSRRFSRRLLYSTEASNK